MSRALVNPVVMQEVLQESRCAVAPVWDPGEGEDYDVAPEAASRVATGRQLVAMDPNMDHMMSPQYPYSNLDCAVSLYPSVGRLMQQNNPMSGLQHPSVGRFKRRSNVATTPLLDLKCAGFAVLGSWGRRRRERRPVIVVHQQQCRGPALLPEYRTHIAGATSSTSRSSYRSSLQDDACQLVPPAILQSDAQAVEEVPYLFSYHIVADVAGGPECIAKSI